MTSPELLSLNSGTDRVTDDLRRTIGYLVSDRNGRLVGKVERPMYGPDSGTPDALAVKARRLTQHRFVVPADAIIEIDDRSCVVGLRVDRETIESVL